MDVALSHQAHHLSLTPSPILLTLLVSRVRCLVYRNPSSCAVPLDSFSFGSFFCFISEVLDSSSAFSFLGLHERVWDFFAAVEGGDEDEEGSAGD
jgi:hypothetical protein